MSNKEYLFIQDLVNEFRIHEMTFYKLIRDKKLPAFKIGSKWSVRRSDLNKFLENHALPEETKPVRKKPGFFDRPLVYNGKKEESKQTRYEYNMQILEELKEYISKYPDQRFGQALWSLNILRWGGTNKDRLIDPFHEESKDLLERIKDGTMAK